jgi:hypothetical protein
LGARTGSGQQHNTKAEAPRLPAGGQASLEERARALEEELEHLRKATHHSQSLTGILLLLIFLMGATAWILWSA